MRTVFFDFDNTVCKTDSILPYLLFCIRKGEASPLQLFRAFAGWLGQRVLKGNVIVAKERTLSFIRGKVPEEMAPVGKAFLQAHVAGRLYPEAKAAMERLKAEGFRIVVVSASADVYLRFLPELLPVDQVICTSCLTENGRYSGKMSPNCRGEEKPRRIAAAFPGETIPYAECFAFGDSMGDLPMLRLVGHPTLVNPKAKLRASLPDAPVVHWQV